MSEHCRMLPNGGTRECGNPASLGWESEMGGLVPICEDCIRWTGQNRRFLKPLTESPAVSDREQNK